MNAPVTIRLDETDHERAMRASISMHCPNEDAFSMACRIDIATMRDLAAAGMFRASRGAAVLLAEVSRIATSAVYAPMTPRDLVRTKFALRLTIEAARELERVGVDGR